jgi:peroxiredoxin
MGRLVYVAADAEPGIKAIERAKATGVKADPIDSAPGKQRNYLRTSLEKFGPIKWEPYAAPALEVLDMTGKTVKLKEYRGKNVMLVFFLGEECPHCMRQLRDIGKKKEDWERLDTALLAVSSAKPKQVSDDVKAQGEHPFRLLSDEKHVNAQRFQSYDDFEDMELHSTILIDKKGRVYWARFGGEPFTDIPFLTQQIERMNELVSAEESAAASKGQ